MAMHTMAVIVTKGIINLFVMRLFQSRYLLSFICLFACGRYDDDAFLIFPRLLRRLKAMCDPSDIAFVELAGPRDIAGLVGIGGLDHGYAGADAIVTHDEARNVAIGRIRPSRPEAAILANS